METNLGTFCKIAWEDKSLLFMKINKQVVYETEEGIFLGPNVNTFFIFNIFEIENFLYLAM